MAQIVVLDDYRQAPKRTSRLAEPLQKMRSRILATAPQHLSEKQILIAMAAHISLYGTHVLENRLRATSHTQIELEIEADPDSRYYINRSGKVRVGPSVLSSDPIHEDDSHKILTTYTQLKQMSLGEIPNEHV